MVSGYACESWLEILLLVDTYYPTYIFLIHQMGFSASTTLSQENELIHLAVEFG